MNTQFSDTGAPQSEPRPPVIRDGDEGAPLSFEERDEKFRLRFAGILSFCDLGDNSHWWNGTHEKAKLKSEFKTFLDSATTCVGSGANFMIVGITTAKLVQAKDSSGKAFLARVQNVKRSPSGEPIFATRMLSLWKFCEDFEPDESWMTKSEWKAILESCREALDADRANDLADAKHRQEHEAQLRQAREAQLNPSEALASGIAKGVAAALIQLGITPNINASKP